MRLNLLVLLALLLVPSALHAEKLPPRRSEANQGDVHLEVMDLTPRFLAFYRAAQDTEGDARFALWLEHYDFAAVPPGPRGQELARRLLDGAWSRYRTALPQLEAGAARLGNEPVEVLARVARVLGVRGPLKIRLTTYIGAFDNNAFTSRTSQGTPNVYFALETSPERKRVILPHEMTHAVHLQLAGLSGGWERTIGATLLMEGLAVHVTRSVAPGFTDGEYIEYTPGWWTAAQQRRRAILAGILPVLAESNPETVFRFTMGSGAAGLEREAYATGYWVVEQLRRDGMSLARIARVPEREMPALARRAIERLLAARD